MLDATLRLDDSNLGVSGYTGSSNSCQSWALALVAHIGEAVMKHASSVPLDRHPRSDPMQG